MSDNSKSSTKVVKTVNEWKKKKVHEGVTLPSGAEVSIQIPNLPALIKSGKIPNNLLDEAIRAAEGEKISAEAIGEQNDFTRKMVALTVVEPEVSEEDVDEIPFEDVEMLVSIATRQRDIDAEGKHLGGLHNSDEWRRFREFPRRDEDLAS